MLEKRIRVLCVLALCITLGLITRIFYYSYFKNEQFKNAVDKQSTRVITYCDMRKTIFDRNHIPLTEREIQSLYLTKDGSLSRDENQSFKSLPVFARYSKSTLASHLIGYVAEDSSGMSGVEKKLDTRLKTQSELKISFFSDALSRPLSNTDVYRDFENPQRNGICLTIDYHIQKIAEDVLDKYIKCGCAVILDTKSFEILAMASRPDFSPNNILEIKDDSSPLLNRAICQYNAGSIFKIVTSAAILEKDFNYLGTTHYCNGKYESLNTCEQNHIFHCHKRDGHGYISFCDGFAKSCNCTFFEVGKQIGAHNIVNCAKSFGFGQTHLCLGDEEAPGNVMEKESYNESDVLNMSIGQGEILVTPLQCAIMTATIANGGVRCDVSVVKDHLPKNLHPVTSQRVADAIAMMMRQCVISGTARDASASPFEIAGKTGSAETGWIDSDGQFAVHGWFCGFFPYSEPKYAMVIFCENGKSGAQSCVEPFVEICEKINEFYPIKQ